MSEYLAFENLLGDYKNEIWLDQDAQVQVLSHFKERLLQQANNLTTEIEQAHRKKQVDFGDYSVYTGAAGVALLHLKRYQLDKDMKHIQSALDLVFPYLQQLRGREKDCTFLCGDCGPLAIGAVLFKIAGEDYSSYKNECISRILKIQDAVCGSQRLPDEMLYGRAGYLFTLLFLQNHLGDDTINKDVIIKVCHSIVKSGESLAQKLNVPCLMYVWYNVFYTGAAHGLIGIFYLLLKVGNSIVQSGLHSEQTRGLPLSYTWHSKHYIGGAHGLSGIFYMLLKVSQKYPEFNVDNVLRPSVDYVLGLRFSSGNYPSSLESGERDRLIHWCHGAPGAIYMFAAAFERYGDNKYKTAVLDCADVIWKRGLLKKGYGICHGVAGNAYAFLCAYRLTGNQKYLHQACRFAEWCINYGQHGCRTPDRPFSLFEGMAGTAYFLLDLIHPQAARFPGFEV